LLNKLNLFERLPTPVDVGKEIIKRVGLLALKPLEDEGLGERLAREHDRTQLDIGLTELSRHQNNPEIALLDGRLILSTMAKSMRTELDDNFSLAERVTVIYIVMGNHFPEHSFDDFALDAEAVEALRRHVPEY
jgi:hypothetical protein